MEMDSRRLNNSINDVIQGTRLTPSDSDPCVRHLSGMVMQLSEILKVTIRNYDARIEKLNDEIKKLKGK